jgi:timeless protein
MEQETLGKSYFLWLITYFLRFTSQMELKIKYLKDVFNVDILCYLTFEAFRKTEEFEAKSLQTSANLKKRLRRLRLNVSAIREYLLALDKYSRSSYKTTEHGPLCRDYKYEENISQMQSYLQVMHNLRQLFLLQLRLFNSSTQSRQYLCDVITANHVLLLLLERAESHSPSSSFDVCQYLKHFCTKTILSRYGTALEDFMTNGHFVNDCIFTMLHHIGCDLGRPDLLCDAVFLRSFSKMLMGGFHVRYFKMLI